MRAFIQQKAAARPPDFQDWNPEDYLAAGANETTEDRMNRMPKARILQLQCCSRL
jgi:hypothetical protein